VRARCHCVDIVSQKLQPQVVLAGTARVPGRTSTFLYVNSVAVRSVSSPPSRIRQSWKRFSAACPSPPNRRQLLPLATSHAACLKTSFLRPARIRVSLRRLNPQNRTCELPNRPPNPEFRLNSRPPRLNAHYATQRTIRAALRYL